MIHDAKIEVTCDQCSSGSATYDVPFRYRTMSETSGYYDANDDEIEDWLRDEDWIVRDGMHYCCKHCAAMSHKA